MNYESGKAKAIGVSNFHKHHLEELLADAKIQPVLDQVELHPSLSQKDLVDYLSSKDIKTEAYSPLGRGGDMKSPIIVGLSEKYHKSAAQIILRWHLQNGIIAIPKSIHMNRIKENIDIFDFELSEVEMEKIDELNTGNRLLPNPDNFDF